MAVDNGFASDPNAFINYVTAKIVNMRQEFDDITGAKTWINTLTSQQRTDLFGAAASDVFNAVTDWAQLGLVAAGADVRTPAYNYYSSARKLGNFYLSGPN